MGGVAPWLPRHPARSSQAFEYRERRRPVSGPQLPPGRPSHWPDLPPLPLRRRLTAAALIPRERVVRHRLLILSYFLVEGAALNGSKRRAVTVLGSSAESVSSAVPSKWGASREGRFFKPRPGELWRKASRPGVFETCTIRRPPSRAVSTRISAPSMWALTPCLIAFSTKVCTENAGTSASSV